MLPQRRDQGAPARRVPAAGPAEIALELAAGDPPRGTLEELNRNYIRSVRMSDVRWFDQNLAEDFLNSNADGSLVDRAGFLAQVARPCPV